MHDSAKTILQIDEDQNKNRSSKPSSSANEARFFISMLVEFVVLVKNQYFPKRTTFSELSKENACKFKNLCFKLSDLRKKS